MSTVLAVATGTGNSLFAADRIGHDYLFFAEDLISGKSVFPDDMDRLGIIFLYIAAAYHPQYSIL